MKIKKSIRNLDNFVHCTTGKRVKISLYFGRQRALVVLFR